MNLLFDLFRGGLIFEITRPSEAEIAQNAGAVAVLLDMDHSPLHPDGNTEILDAVLNRVSIPVLASFRPGHFVEAEMLTRMGVWGVYADSRFHSVSSTKKPSSENSFPYLADVESLDEIEEHFVPVLRAEDSVEEIFPELEKKKKKDFVFTAGPIETVADIALLRRMGADVVIVPHSIFSFSDVKEYAHKLVQASLYFDNTEKLATILEKEEELPHRESRILKMLKKLIERMK